MTRERLTWKNKRVASPPPAIPMEEGGYEHPASYEDPEADKYFVGQNEPAQWAEDPTTGPYENSPHPAVPTEPGGYNHPAGDPKNLRVAATRKAAKCIRIAENLFGKTISVDDIEARALSMMDWPENHVDAALERIAGGFADSEDFFDEDFGSELDALETRLANRSTQASVEERMFAEMLAEERQGSRRRAEWYMEDEYMDDEEEEAMGGYAAMDEEEAMLDEMLMSMMEDEGEDEDEGMADEEEAMLEEMMRLAKKAEEDEEEESDEEEEEEDEEEEESEDEGEEKEGGKKAYSELDVVMDSSEDAMGLSGNAESSDLLAQLYAKSAAEDEGEEEGEEEEEKEGSKKSASSKLRPRAPKPNKGPKVLGNVSKKTASEIQDLENLWDSAPDVSDIF